MIVSVGFFPPINLSWLRALYIRVLPFRIPIASSNDASVRERAKLTCLVLWKIKRKLREEGSSINSSRVAFEKRTMLCFSAMSGSYRRPYPQTDNNKSVRKNLIIFYEKYFRTIKTELVRMPLGEIYGFHTAFLKIYFSSASSHEGQIRSCKKHRKLI